MYKKVHGKISRFGHEEHDIFVINKKKYCIIIIGFCKHGHWEGGW